MSRTRVCRATKRPIGSAVRVFNLRAAQKTARREFGTAGRDRILLSVPERKGNIWMAEWYGR